jgi:hypothetical protein
MSHKKPRYELPDEVIAVLESSTSNLVPCKKFRHADIYRFADHMKNDKCQECVAWFQQTDKELKTIRLLAAWRKSKNN